MKPKELTGLTVGRLNVVRKLKRIDLRWPLCIEPNSFWECACSCGATCVVRGCNLARGLTRSCGCMKHESLVRMNERRYGPGSVSPSAFLASREIASR